MRFVLLVALIGALAFLPGGEAWFGGGAAKAGGAKKAAGPFTITVKQSFFKDAQLKVDSGGVNLRKELLAKKIDLYPLQGKVYNCGGAGVCGTCAVAVEKGMENLSPKSPNESRTLGNKPANYRLACTTKCQGDVTIKIKP